MSLLGGRHRQTGLYSRGTTINLLRFFWLFVVVWCEVGAFFWSLSDCRWPDKAFKKVRFSAIRFGDATSLFHAMGIQSDKLASPSHVMILADPHFQDPNALSHTHRPPWFSTFKQFFVHLNLRKSWNAASRLNPHLVIVLGDMLDKGRAIMTDEELVHFVAM